jgi:hypothetical protein
MHFPLYLLSISVGNYGAAPCCFFAANLGERAISQSLIGACFLRLKIIETSKIGKYQRLCRILPLIQTFWG